MLLLSSDLILGHSCCIVGKGRESLLDVSALSAKKILYHFQIIMCIIILKGTCSKLSQNVTAELQLEPGSSIKTASTSVL